MCLHTAYHLGDLLMIQELHITNPFVFYTLTRKCQVALRYFILSNMTTAQQTVNRGLKSRYATVDFFI